ncbi:MAG: hypothetical protein ABR567_05035 [Myxococcales bacterium]|nr:hypothetical protein [Myxococcales bacterium]
MVATVVIDPPSVVALGAIFTLFAARSVAAGSPLRRSVLVGAGVGGWMGLCFGVQSFKQPAWMLVYLVDPRTLPAAVWYPFFLAAMVASGAIGAFFAHRFIAAGRRNRALWLAVAMLAVWLLLFALTFRRYLAVGTYDEFRSGRARPLSQQPAVVQDFNLVTLMTAVPLLALLGAITWRNRRRAAAAL